MILDKEPFIYELNYETLKFIHLVALVIILNYSLFGSIEI